MLNINAYSLLIKKLLGSTEPITQEYFEFSKFLLYSMIILPLIRVQLKTFKSELESEPIPSMKDSASFLSIIPKLS